MSNASFNKNDAHRAERGVTMENEKKELNSSEMDQVSGGSFVSKNSKIIKRTAKKTSENQTQEERFLRQVLNSIY